MDYGILKQSTETSPQGFFKLERLMSVAIIETGGKQYLVREGAEVLVERLDGEPESKRNFDDLLNNKKVTATVVGHDRAAKVNVRKFKSKVRYLRRRGHRQHQSTLHIDKIS